MRVILADSLKEKAYWLLLARKYREANWKRDMDGNWDGEIDGVRLTILKAEAKKPEPELVPLVMFGRSIIN